LEKALNRSEASNPQVAKNTASNAKKNLVQVLTDESQLKVADNLRKAVNAITYLLSAL